MMVNKAAEVVLFMVKQARAFWRYTAVMAWHPCANGIVEATPRIYEAATS